MVYIISWWFIIRWFKGQVLKLPYFGILFLKLSMCRDIEAVQYEGDHTMLGGGTYYARVQGDQWNTVSCFRLETKSKLAIIYLTVFATDKKIRRSISGWVT